MDPLCTKTLCGIFFFVVSHVLPHRCVLTVLERSGRPVGNPLKGDAAALKDLQVCLNTEAHAEKHTPGSLDAEYSAVEYHLV